MGHPFQKEVLVAQKLAQKAGEMAKSLQTNILFSQKKDGAGPVSEADLKADEIIRTGLAAEFPEDLVISEESTDPDGLLPQAHRIWLVDPIDGTADYVQGGPDYSVMIGLLVDGVPALGIVYGPESATTWTGVVWREGSEEKCFAERQKDGEIAVQLDLGSAVVENPIVTVSKNHPSRLADRVISLLEPAELIKMGSIGLKLAFISEGKADLYVATTRRIKVWDTCAPFALLKAAGGFSYTFLGQPVVFGPTLTHTTPFFATSPGFAPTILLKLGLPAFDFIKEF
jgi:3'(2'), 5'-bisphosphate nucleotidase